MVKEYCVESRADHTLAWRTRVWSATALTLLRKPHGLLEEHGAQNEVLLYDDRKGYLLLASAGRAMTVGQLAIEKK
jgi:hypothetical protein